MAKNSEPRTRFWRLGRSRSFTLMELMLTITLAALIIGITVPTFIGINRGASAKHANSLVYAFLRDAKQRAFLRRQRVGFYVVTSVLADNPYVSTNMVNRAFFIYAAATPNLSDPEAFLTSIQTLPTPMMFDFSGGAGSSSTAIPTVTMIDASSGTAYFTARGFRFAPSGDGLYMEDLDASSTGGYNFDVVICEGIITQGGVYTLKPNSPIRYTNSVNAFTGKVYSR